MSWKQARWGKGAMGRVGKTVDAFEGSKVAGGKTVEGGVDVKG